MSEPDFPAPHGGPLRRPAKPFGLRALVAVGAAVAVAGLLTLALPRVSAPGATLTVHVMRGAQVQVIAPGETLHPDDALRFVVWSAAPGYAAVLERDPSGKVTVVAPFAATSPMRVGEGSAEMPDSAYLDGALGTEWLFGVTSPEPFDLIAVGKQLAGQSDPGSLDAVCPKCKVDALRFDKRPAVAR